MIIRQQQPAAIPRLGLGQHEGLGHEDMGALVHFPQRWKTSPLPWSLALKNTIHTGTTFDTPSGGIANAKWWATRGLQGYGPRIQYGTSAGMDGGMGCGGCDCGCGCNGGSSSTLLWLAAAGAAAYFLFGRGGRFES